MKAYKGVNEPKGIVRFPHRISEESQSHIDTGFTMSALQCDLEVGGVLPLLAGCEVGVLVFIVIVTNGTHFLGTGLPLPWSYPTVFRKLSSDPYFYRC